MRIKTIVLSLLISLTTHNIAQNIEVKIIGTKEKATLLELEGEKTIEVDSVIFKGDSFQFSLSDKHTGFYRLKFDNKHWIDFICDGKDVELKTDYNNLFDSLKVIESESNKLYYEFLKQNRDYKTKSELLNLILARFPKDDKYYSDTKQRLKEIQTEYSRFIESASQRNPSSFIARYIFSAQLPIIRESIPIDEQLDYLKKNALKNLDFSDDELIYSDLFTNKSVEYLTYYRNPQLPKGLLEKEFTKAVDTLLTKAKVNDIVYKHITEYLIDGFTKFGFDNIIDYIVTNYVMVDDLCLDKGTGNSIQNRVNQAKLLKVGDMVPNIIIPDTSGKDIDQSELTSERTLILFYASWCTHCQTMIPQIKELYDNSGREKFEVLAVSLDTNSNEWLSFINENVLNWLNVSDLKGWDSQAARSFYIYATPTMFLVDKDKKIIAKPLTIEELKLTL